jgi:predicted nucleic acid-binding protein
MQKTVLDASMALAWIYKRPTKEEADLAERMLRNLNDLEIWVPALWYTEISNSLVKLERRAVLQEAQITRYLTELYKLTINIDRMMPQDLCHRIIASGREHKLTAYDATYLDLALRLDATLATFDTQLAKAIIQAGGKVFQ